MSMTSIRHAVRRVLGTEEMAWLSDALGRTAVAPAEVRSLFPAVGRRCGRGELDPAVPALRGWTIDDGARTLLLSVLQQPTLDEELPDLYRYGDAAEKRAVLRSMSVLPVGEAGLPLVLDALRTNDPRLVAAALGGYGASRLDDAAYRQGVLKCVFMGIPLASIRGLPERRDAELERMLRSFAEERRAAGRSVPRDLVSLVPDLEKEA